MERKVDEMKERDLFKRAVNSKFNKDHIKTRVMACVESENAEVNYFMKNKIKKRVLLTFCIILIASLTLGSLTVYAHYSGLIELSFLRKAPATSWPEDAVYAREVNLLLDEWNENRREQGFDLFDSLLLTQMYTHSDITLREIFDLYGKNFPPENEIKEIFEEYKKLNELLEEKESGKDKYIQLLADRDNGIDLDPQDIKFISEFDLLTYSINHMRFDRSMKLVELLRKYSEGECVDTLVPEALLKQNDDLQNNDLSPGMIEYTAEFHSIDLEYSDKNPIVFPTYFLMMEAYYERYREESYGKHSSLTEEQIQETAENTVVTKEDLETVIRRFYDVKVKVIHQSVTNEDERLNISYDSLTETYVFTPWVSNPEMTFAYVFDEVTEGNRIICTIAFLHFKGVGLYDGIYYDDYRNPVLVHEVTNVWPESYAVDAIKDILPKWEFVFEKHINEYNELRLRIVSAKRR